MTHCVWGGALLAVVLIAGAETPRVRLHVDPGCPCGLSSSASASLAAEGVSVAPSDDGTAWVLLVRAEGQSVLVTLEDSQSQVRGARRLNPTAGDCPVVGRSVALLVKAWLAARLRPPGPAGQRAPAEVP